MDNKNTENYKNFMTLEIMLHPIDPKVFWTKYWGKQHLVIRRYSILKTMYTWKNFNNHLNQYPEIPGLKIINKELFPKEEWDYKKIKLGKSKMPLLSKKEIYNAWQKGSTFVLPFAEYQRESLYSVCEEFERYFDRGQINIYCSSGNNSDSFPAHSDSTENFLFHCEGRVAWTIYEEFAPNKPKNIKAQFILEPGDLLYIPQYQYHKVDVLEPRILVSAHFANKKQQSLKSFNITPKGESKRIKWYNFEDTCGCNKT